jgi:hypothetical protein
LTLALEDVMSAHWYIFLFMSLNNYFLNKK